MENTKDDHPLVPEHNLVPSHVLQNGPTPTPPPSSKSVQMAQNGQIMVVGEAPAKLSDRVGRLHGYKGVICQSDMVDRTAKCGQAGIGKLEKKNRGVVVRRFLEKGKRKWFKKIKRKQFSPVIQNGAVNLEK
ncbi:hypothetical protein LWI29_022517 [Acer saccharum]|uniref:Uncharacterized protein n=1 Tax=Acer saccharum TaxID=4024 RepID=A0AA39T501_ACESA|nr:hypothetical protein LWI29_022517 [Acer saccharum]